MFPASQFAYEGVPAVTVQFGAIDVLPVASAEQAIPPADQPVPEHFVSNRIDSTGERL